MGACVMFVPVDVSAKEAVAAVSTGDLPAPELIANVLREAYDEMGVPAQEFDRLITGEEEQT
jgi:hypothetical protein